VDKGSDQRGCGTAKQRLFLLTHNVPAFLDALNGRFAAKKG